MFKNLNIFRKYYKYTQYYAYWVQEVWTFTLKMTKNKFTLNSLFLNSPCSIVRNSSSVCYKSSAYRTVYKFYNFRTL